MVKFAMPSRTLIAWLLVAAFAAAANIHLGVIDSSRISDSQFLANANREYLIGSTVAFQQVNRAGGIQGQHNITWGYVDGANKSQVIEAIEADKYVALFSIWNPPWDLKEVTERLLAKRMVVLDVGNSEPGFFENNLPFISINTRFEADIAGIVSHAIGRKHSRRLALASVNYTGPERIRSDGVRREVLRAMAAVDKGSVGEYVMEEFEDTEASNERLRQWAQEVQPDAVVVSGVPGSAMARLLLVLFANLTKWTNAPTVNFYVESTASAVAEPMFQYTHDVSNISVHWTTPAKWTTFSSSSLVQEFAVDMTPTFYPLRGYVAGRAVVEMLQRTPVHTRQGFWDTVFSHTVFTSADRSVGMFAENCSADATALPMCRCNIGARTYDMVVLDKGRVPKQEIEGTFSYPMTRCDVDYALDVRRGVLLMALQSNASSNAFRVVTDAANSVLDAAFEARSDSVIADSMSSAHEIAAFKEVTAFPFANVSGESDEAPGHDTDHGSLIAPFIDPITEWPKLVPRTFRRDVLYLQQTLQQELFAWASAVANGTLPAISSILVHREAISSELRGVLDASFGSFRLATPVIVVWSGTDNITLVLEDVIGALQPNDTIGVIGVDAEQLEELIEFVRSPSSSGTKVIMAAHDGSKHFAHLNSTIAEVKRRFLYFSSLPLVEGTYRAEYERLLFRLSVPPTPLQMHAFFIGRFIGAVVSQMKRGVTGAAFLHRLYGVSIITISDGVSAGPFRDCAAGESTSDCGCNIGSRSVSLLSIQGAAAQPYSVAFTECQVQYTQFGSNKFLTPLALGIIIAGAALLLLFIAFVWKMTLGILADRRDIRFAPIDDTKPVAVMFTDIQSSSTLWNKLPEHMGAVLDVHHEVIRKLIHSHQCYEVKTIGDSFMVVSSDAAKMVRLAHQIQLALHDAQWPAHDKIEVFYAESDRKLEAEGECHPIAPQAWDESHSPNRRRAEWNGLRVRIGLHFGDVEITFDPVSKGYDYYGRTINAAARIESLATGGQIIASTDLLRAAGNAIGTFTHTPLGMRSLRGIPEKIEVSQIDVLGRRYPALREETEIEGEVFDNIEQLVAAQANEFSLRSGMYVDSIGEEYLARNSHCREEMLRSSTTLFLAFSSCPPATRLSLVKQLCQRWHVDYSILSRRRKKEAVDSCIWALAERLAQVSHEGDLMRSSLQEYSPQREQRGSSILLGRSPQKVFSRY